MTKPTQSLEEILDDFGHDVVNGAMRVSPEVSKTKQAILDWVNREIIGQGIIGQDVLKNRRPAGLASESCRGGYIKTIYELRADQRHQLRKHGWKEQN